MMSSSKQTRPKTPSSRPESLSIPSSPARRTSPASSLASISLPTPTGTTPASALSPTGGLPPSRQKSRARDLLRKHYGVGLTVPVASGRPNDPMDIDSAAFDARAYYEQLVATSSLTTLLKRENELVSEIRQLEGERQSLVYNHHHELIAASDTIRAMKSRAESLDVDLEKLKVAFSEISRLGAEVAVENRTATRGRRNSKTGDGDNAANSPS